MIPKNKNVTLQGMKFGVLSAFIGCAIFVFIEQSRLILKFGFGGTTEFEFAMLLLFFGSAIMIIPAMLGSSLLSLLLINETHKKRLTVPKAMQIGAAIGVATGLGLSLLGVILVYGRGSMAIYLFHVIEVIVIASLSGGWTGKKLAQYIIDEAGSTILKR